MNILAWILQIYLGILFIYSGIMKGTRSKEYLVRAGQTGVANLSYPLIRSIAILEILGAFGIIFPWAFNIMPVLTLIAAMGFAIIMILAASIHYRRKEYKSVVGVNLTTFLICVFVVYVRWSQLFS